jgi:hypothetical protein
MYGSAAAKQLPVKNGDAAVEGDELGTGTLERADQRLLLPLMLAELDLDEMNSVA